MFLFLQIGTDVENYARAKEEKYTQPFILTLGPATKPQQYFLICDRVAILAGTATEVAFDRAFKAHYAFNVSFAGCLHSFYTYFAAVAYKCTTHNTTGKGLQLNVEHRHLNLCHACVVFYSVLVL